jgi:hypothetical protein
MHRRLLTALLAAAIAPLPAIPAAASPGVAHIRGGETVPVYSYEKAIRESVWVQAPTDADADGVLDRVAVDLANAVAATGVRGLETIVGIAAISSWYDHMRYNGTLRSSGYPSYLQRVVSNSLDRCGAVSESLANDSAEETASYNAFWAKRDFRPDASRVRASARVRVDRPATQLSARLVDYGTATRVDYGLGEGVRTLTTSSCYGESTSYDDVCYRDVAERRVTSDNAILTRSWRDAAHHVSLRLVTPLKPGR